MKLPKIEMKYVYFVLGCGVAGVLGYKLGTKHTTDFYEARIEEEISSVVNRFKHIESTMKDNEKKMAQNEEILRTLHELKDESEQMLPQGVVLSEKDLSADAGMKEYEKMYENREKFNAGMLDPDTDYSQPYVITPEECGATFEVDVRTLTYWGDGVLTDDDNAIIDNVLLVVGIDWLHRFGEYEKDMVYVHNPNFGADYEIYRTDELYKDYAMQNPHKVTLYALEEILDEQDE